MTRSPCVCVSGGDVRYNIYSGDPDGAFSIDAQTGEITTAGQLDHEQHSSVLLNVQAVSGQPPTFGHSQVRLTTSGWLRALRCSCRSEEVIDRPSVTGTV